MTNATTIPDFGDWVHPMLVKEFRQGLRARVFEVSFILLQLLMVSCMVIAVSSYGTRTDSFYANDIFWWVIGFVFLIALPSRGLTTLSSEIKENTLELIYLTRITSGWIVTSKWMAVMAQTVLAACSILPYLVLRYFMGGIDLISEMGVLGILLIISGLMTGATVAVSTIRSGIIRIIALVFSLFALLFVMALFGAASGGTLPGFIILLLIAGFFFLAMMFIIATARVGPPSLYSLQGVSQSYQDHGYNY